MQMICMNSPNMTKTQLFEKINQYYANEEYEKLFDTVDQLLNLPARLFTPKELEKWLNYEKDLKKIISKKKKQDQEVQRKKAIRTIRSGERSTSIAQVRSRMLSELDKLEDLVDDD